MVSFVLNKLDTNNLNFFKNLKFFLKKNLEYKKVENVVKNIIFNVKKFKDKSLLYYINKFDNLNIDNVKNIKINYSDIENSFYSLSKKVRYILEILKNRIDFYHEKQKNVYYNSWRFMENDGTFWGQKVNLIERLGFYIPGGKAVYPSSIFMVSASSNLLNVKNNNIFVSIPLNKNNKNYKLVLGAFYLSNIKNIFLMGGAHSISSMAYGTNLVSKVDKIFGPGNSYVALAKKIIYGDTGIDMIAGPSEVVILLDHFFNNLEILVMDLFSQCEHDFLSQSIILCSDFSILYKIEEIVNNLLPFMIRKKIIFESLKNKTFLIKTNNIIESCNIINYLAPEHLILYSKNYNDIFKYIKNSGSVFLGNYCSESFGDYSLGLNHILPTYQNSKFSSPLGIYDYFKKMNFSSLNFLGFKKLFNLTSNFALKETLYAHSENLLLRNYLIFS